MSGWRCLTPANTSRGGGEPRSGLGVVGSCTWCPRRPGTLPCLPFHFRTRLRGAGESPRVVGVRAGRDSAQPGIGLALPSTLWEAFSKCFWFFSARFCGEERLRTAPAQDASSLLPDFSRSLGRGGGKKRGQALEDSWALSSPAPLRELRLFWKLLEPGAPPWCPDAGAKGDCAVAPPPRVALADACPAVTRVCPRTTATILVVFGLTLHCSPVC